MAQYSLAGLRDVSMAVCPEPTIPLLYEAQRSGKILIAYGRVYVTPTRLQGFVVSNEENRSVYYFYLSYK